MVFDDMPHCCGAVVLNDFGGGEFHDVDQKDVLSTEGAYSHRRVSVKVAEEELNRIFTQMKRRGNPQIIFATTTSNQSGAIELLTRMGFYTQPHPTKLRDGRYLQGWFLPLNEWEP